MAFSSDSVIVSRAGEDGAEDTGTGLLARRGRDREACKEDRRAEPPEDGGLEDMHIVGSREEVRYGCYRHT